MEAVGGPSGFQHGEDDGEMNFDLGPDDRRGSLSCLIDGSQLGETVARSGGWVACIHGIRGYVAEGYLE